MSAPGVPTRLRLLPGHISAGDDVDPGAQCIFQHHLCHRNRRLDLYLANLLKQLGNPGFWEGLLGVDGDQRVHTVPYRTVVADTIRRGLVGCAARMRSTVAGVALEAQDRAALVVT